jgi:hypothetical protein
MKGCQYVIYLLIFGTVSCHENETTIAGKLLQNLDDSVGVEMHCLR